MIPRLYQALLRLYPGDFRERFGRGMVDTFVLRADEARRDNGSVAMAWFYLREAAGLAFGAMQQWMRRLTNGRMTMSSTMTEIRHALRRLARSPGFTMATVLTLALAIGANTAIFSVVDAIVLSPLPYPESDRLVWLDHRAPGIGLENRGLSMSQGAYRFYRENNHTLEEAAIYRTFETTLTGDGEAERVPTLQATYTMFQVLRARPLMGRLFNEDDRYDQDGGVAILSHGLWTRRYGADPEILGRIIQVQNIAHEVVGVLPPDTYYPDPSTALYVPTVVGTGFGGWTVRGIGRMKPGVTPADVEADIASLIPRMPEAFEGDFARRSVENARIAPVILPLKEHVVGDVEATLWILMGTVGFVLLIAAANVANLFLVRAQGRRREVAVRAAMGAGRGSLVRYYLSEAGILAAVGGLVGLGGAAYALGALAAHGPEGLPRLHEVTMDGGVLTFTALVTIGTCLTFGILPLLHGSSVVESLKSGARGATGDVAGRRTRNLLVVGQVALALMLLVGSGLMVQSFRNLRGVEPGFQADNVLSFEIGVSATSHPQAADAALFHQTALDRLAAIPGVELAGAIDCLPLLRSCKRGDPLYQEGHLYGPDETPPIVMLTVASPGLFRTLRVPLLEGRTFERSDHEQETGAVVVSQALADRFWPGEPALGRRVTTRRPGDDPVWYTVVGVVGSVRSDGLTEDPVSILYYPMVRPQGAGRTLSLYYALKTAVPPLSLVATVRDRIRELNPDVPLSHVQTMESVLAGASATTRFTMVLLAVAAGVALVLGLVGIYGVISYVVGLRKAEIGVRMALGAGVGQVRGMVLRQGGLLAATGVVLGLGGAFALSRLMSSVVFGVSATDPLTYGVTAATLMAVALVATWVPASRATRVNPVEALRTE